MTRLWTYWDLYSPTIWPPTYLNGQYTCTSRWVPPQLISKAKTTMMNNARHGIETAPLGVEKTVNKFVELNRPYKFTDFAGSLLHIQGDMGHSYLRHAIRRQKRRMWKDKWYGTSMVTCSIMMIHNFNHV